MRAKRVKEGPKRLAPIQMAACKHLSPDDCTEHPNCQWVKEFETKTGAKVSAHCGTKAKVTYLVKPKPRVRRAATAKQLKALEKARAARAMYAEARKIGELAI